MQKENTLFNLMVFGVLKIIEMQQHILDKLENTTLVMLTNGLKQKLID